MSLPCLELYKGSPSVTLRIKSWLPLMRPPTPIPTRSFMSPGSVYLWDYLLHFSLCVTPLQPHCCFAVSHTPEPCLFQSQGFPPVYCIAYCPILDSHDISSERFTLRFLKHSFPLSLPIVSHHSHICLLLVLGWTLNTEPLWPGSIDILIGWMDVLQSLWKKILGKLFYIIIWQCYYLVDSIWTSHWAKN